MQNTNTININSVDQYKQTISDIITFGCNCVKKYYTTIDEQIHHHFLTNYISCLYPELKECTNIEKHTESVKLIEYELLQIFAYKTRDHYYLENALLKEKNIIFSPNTFFSVMETNNYPAYNFVITRHFTHSCPTLLDLMHGPYLEIVLEKNSRNNAIQFKWDDPNTNIIIDKFLRYKFNKETFGDFVSKIFPETTEDIIISFQILDAHACSITYEIQIPIKNYTYDKDNLIYVNISTGFYGI